MLVITLSGNIHSVSKPCSNVTISKKIVKVFNKKKPPISRNENSHPRAPSPSQCVGATVAVLGRAPSQMSSPHLQALFLPNPKDFWLTLIFFLHTFLPQTVSSYIAPSLQLSILKSFLHPVCCNHPRHVAQPICLLLA